MDGVDGGVCTGLRHGLRVPGTWFWAPLSALICVQDKAAAAGVGQAARTSNAQSFVNFATDDFRPAVDEIQTTPQNSDAFEKGLEESWDGFRTWADRMGGDVTALRTEQFWGFDRAAARLAMLEPVPLPETESRKTT